jgi:hypothetical protein
MAKKGPAHRLGKGFQNGGAGLKSMAALSLGGVKFSEGGPFLIGNKISYLVKFSFVERFKRVADPCGKRATRPPILEGPAGEFGRPKR